MQEVRFPSQQDQAIVSGPFDVERVEPGTSPPPPPKKNHTQRLASMG